eukprot:3353030-Rhodomonas_salina.1
MRRRRPRCRWCGAAGWARGIELCVFSRTHSAARIPPHAFRCTHSAIETEHSTARIPPHAFRCTYPAARV